MSKLEKIRIGKRNVRVAEKKVKYIRNIVDAAEKCDYIDRIVLFGSSIQERCKASSDIDIAVFGSLSKSKCLTSKQYKAFTDQLYGFDDHRQTYDILYFKTNTGNDRFIMREIDRGETIYVREEISA